MKRSLAILVCCLSIWWPLAAVQAQTVKKLTLSQAISLALKQSPLLNSQKSAVLAAKAGVKAAWGQHWPQIDLEAGYTRFSDPTAVVPIKGFNKPPPYFSRDIYEWKLTGNLVLYQGGRIGKAVELSRLKETIAHWHHQLTKEELVANINNIFNRILQLKELLNAQQLTLKALEKVRQDTANLLKVGRVPPVDLMRIDTQIAAQKQALTSTQELLRRTKQDLAYLIGFNPQEVIEPQGKLDFHPFKARFSPKLITNRPDVQAAFNQVKRWQKQVAYEFGGHLPELYLNGYYGHRAGSGFAGADNVWQVGVHVKLNVFSGGIISARVRQAKRRLLEAKWSLQDLKLKANQQILHAISLIEETKTRVTAAKSALQSSKESFRIEKLKYLSGAGTVTDMLLSQAQWLEALSRYYQAVYEYNAAIVAYKMATATILSGRK